MKINIKPYKSYDYGLFRSCYVDYSNELDEIVGEVTDHTSLNRFITAITDDPDVQIYMVYNDAIQIGFLIIGTGSNCHDKCDYFIQDFYVVPKYRRQRLGFSIVELYTKMFRGSYCLRILNKNSAAQKFWSHTWSKLDAKSITNDLIDETPDGQSFYAYKV